MTLPWTSCRVDNAAAHVVGGGGSSASGWGTNGSWLSVTTTTVANDTVTSNNTTDFAIARGSQAHSTGKYYFEVLVVSAPSADAMHIGLLDGTASAGGMNQTNVVNGICTYCNNGTALRDGSSGTVGQADVGSAVTLSNGTILGIAFDADNGFHYLSKNGTFLLSGDPSSGATGTGHIGVYSGSPSMYPRISLWGLVNGVLQLVTGAGALAYLPSGYTAWG
jgi:hypothetical protein